MLSIQRSCVGNPAFHSELPLILEHGNQSAGAMPGWVSRHPATASRQEARTRPRRRDSPWRLRPGQSDPREYPVGADREPKVWLRLADSYESAGEDGRL